jgi:hypothetical protein
MSGRKPQEVVVVADWLLPLLLRIEADEYFLKIQVSTEIMCLTQTTIQFYAIMIF